MVGGASLVSSRHNFLTNGNYFGHILEDKSLPKVMGSSCKDYYLLLGFPW